MLEDEDINIFMSQSSVALDNSESEPEISIFKDKKERKITQAGKIISIKVENFMCHRNFQIDPCRHLNIITGSNGSGKSAIAGALQLCLGARAHATGRGSSSSNLIRSGSNDPAILTVVLSNEGFDAYKRDVYSDRIIIQRKIFPGNRTSYSIRNKDGKVVSTAKEEIDEIVKNFNILVDNPCCILTQNEAKKFIIGDNKSKYKFFLKATGMESLNEQLIISKISLDKTKEKFDESMNQQKKLMNDINNLKSRIDENKKILSLEDDLKYNKGKLLWLDYYSYSKKITKEEKDYKEKQVQYEKFLSEAEDDSQLIESNQLEIKKYEDKIKEIDMVIADGEKELSNNRTKTGRIKKIIEDLSVSKSEILGSIRNLTNYISSQKKKLMEKEAEYNKKNITDIQINELKMRIDRLKEERRIYEENERNETDFLMKNKVELENLVSNLKSKTSYLKELKADQKEIQSFLSNFSSGSFRRESVFGNYMTNLLDQINKTSFERKVYGPLGLYISYHPQKVDWEVAIERTIGMMCTSFIVQTSKDQQKLRGIISSINSWAKPVIILQHPHSRYDVGPSYPNITRVVDILDIKEDIVFNALVDQTRPERVILADDEESSKRFLTRNSENKIEIINKFNSICLANGTMIRYLNGNEANEVNRNPKANYLSKNNDSLLQAKKEDLLHVNVKIQQTEAEIVELNHQISEMNKRVEDNRKSCAKFGSDIRRINQELNDAEDRLMESANNSFDSIDIEKEFLDKYILDKEKEESRLAEINKKIDEVKKKLDIFQKEQIDTIQLNIEKYSNDKEILKKELNQVLKDHQQKIALKNSQRNKIEEHKAFLNKKLEILEQMKSELNTKFHENLSKCKEMNISTEKWDGSSIIELEENETKKDVESKIKDLTNKISVSFGKDTSTLRNKILREINGLQTNLNIIQEEYNEKKQKLEELSINYDISRKSYEMRLKSYEELREKYDRDISNNFKNYLKLKKSNGYIKFDHKEETLDLFYFKDKKIDDENKNEHEHEHDDEDEHEDEHEHEHEHENSIKSKKRKRSKQIEGKSKKKKVHHIGFTDVKNLSGGEKSFVTFAFQLSLSSSIQSPFRLLDEYDVFMDEETRKITMKALQDHSKEFPLCQFFILSPHDCRYVTTTNATRIFKVPEPERQTSGLQQQTLNVSRTQN